MHPLLSTTLNSPSLAPNLNTVCALTGTNMGLRLSMLHNHSPGNDQSTGQAVAGFAKGQGTTSAVYETAMQVGVIVCVIVIVFTCLLTTAPLCVSHPSRVTLFSPPPLASMCVCTACHADCLILNPEIQP
jgi:hypothetical protein